MKNNKIIIGFIGPIASGKGTACAYLQDKYGAVILRFSTILRDILNRLHLEQNRENMQLLSTSLRSIFGEDLLSRVIFDDIKNSDAHIVVLDGVRRESDIKYIKNEPNFYLVEINASPEIRYERIIKRSENTDDKQKTFKQFQADEQQESELQIINLAQTAQFHINNNGTLDNLYNQIDNILKQIS